MARVAGLSGSVITTSDLTVIANQQAPTSPSPGALWRDATTSGGFLDFGNDGVTHGPSTLKRHIFWQTRVIMLGEPNPWLEVDANGNITKIVNVKVTDSDGHVFEDNPFAGPDGVHQGQLTGHTFTVDDIVYDHGARARFLVNNGGSIAGGLDGEIWGQGGVFEFQQTWDYVKLLNASNLNMITNIIDVVNTDNPPRIDIRVDHIPAGAVGNSPSGSVGTPGTTFTFDIKYKFPPSLVQLKNTCPFSCPVRQPFIRMDDYIENPIGKTEIFNASGDILSGPGSEIIRTNILDIDALHGNVGFQSPTHAEPDSSRNPVMVELVKFKHPDPAYCPQGGTGGSAPCTYDFLITVDAAQDVVMDLTANRRTDEALGSPLTVAVERINAGNDVDLVLNDSKNGNDTSSLTLVVVDMYNPATAYYQYVYYNSLPGLGPDSGPLDTGSCSGPYPGDCGTGSGSYETHFRPDATDSNLLHILRALGTTGSDIDSTYDFAGVRAGDDIDICHVSVLTNGEPKTCFTTEVNDATHVVTADTPDKLVHITINTDVDWTGGSDPGDLDDPGMTRPVSQIFIRTNGNIVATELVGDMLVGSIISTQGDVTLHSPVRILDADGRPTIDVAGHNITMYAGEAGGLGGIGEPVADLVSVTLRGGFLEVDTALGVPAGSWTNPSQGVLKAYDTTNDSSTLASPSSEGIYLDEIVGDMPVWEIFTRGNGLLTTGNVSLRTATSGSVLNAKGNDEDNVRGQSVDIDANGGTIGLATRDLNIDSARAPPFGCTYVNCGDVPTTGTPSTPNGTNWGGGTSDPALSTLGDDVSLESSGGIYLTETDSYLRLALAHASGGDIRLTVRETADLDEDVYLVSNGSARFAESSGRSTGDAPRNIPKGQIFAEAGNVLLQVGDDVTTHENSEILAFGSIDIRGDHLVATDTLAGADPHFGTNMILRGRIIANCTVSAGGASGYPVGTCAPSTSNPVSNKLTQIWGGDDVDSFQFGDRSGITGGTVAGSGVPTSGTPAPASGAPAPAAASCSSARRPSSAAAPARPPPATAPTTRRSPTARTSSPSTSCSR